MPPAEQSQRHTKQNLKRLYHGAFLPDKTCCGAHGLAEMWLADKLCSVASVPWLGQEA